MSDEQPPAQIHLVFHAGGALAGVYFGDEGLDQAGYWARAAEGAIVTLPIAEDYRPEAPQ